MQRAWRVSRRGWAGAQPLLLQSLLLSPVSTRLQSLAVKKHTDQEEELILMVKQAVETRPERKG